VLDKRRKGLITYDRAICILDYSLDATKGIRKATVENPALPSIRACALLSSLDCLVSLDDTSLRVTDVVSGRLMRRVFLSELNPDVIATSPDGITAAVTYQRSGITLVNCRTGTTQLRMTAPRLSKVQSLCFSPDGCVIASGHLDGTVSLGRYAQAGSVVVSCHAGRSALFLFLQMVSALHPQAQTLQ